MRQYLHYFVSTVVKFCHKSEFYNPQDAEMKLSSKIQTQLSISTVDKSFLNCTRNILNIVVKVSPRSKLRS